MARIQVHVGGGARGIGRWLSVLLLLVALGVGLLALYAVGVDVWRGVRTYFWDEARCTVVRSEAIEEDGAYRFAVTYRWTRDGARHSGSRYRPGYDSSDDVSEPYRLAGRYPAGAQVRCFVDPDQPREATLERYHLGRIFLLLVPLAFVAIGGGGLWMLWRLARGEPLPGVDAFTGTATKDGGLAGDEDEAKTRRQGAGCLVAFFGIFLLAGLGIFIPFFGLPAWRTWEARDWVPVPATVLSSDVGVHPSDEGDPTYSVDVVFRYEVDGREYRSGRYDFLLGSSSGYEGKAEIVERLPPGTETTAWMDPDDPASAVLSRELRGEWAFGLLPLIFVAAGAGGIFFTVVGSRRLKRRQEAGIDAWRPEAAAAAPEAGAGALVLEERASPLKKLVGASFVALVWNGIVGACGWAWWQEYQSGGVDGCLTAFIIPFGLIGLLLLVGVPYQALAMLNPRPVLGVDTGRLAPGGRATVSWRFRGAEGRIRHLKIVCRGQEKVKYRSGDSTRTESSTFAEIVLADGGAEAVRGSTILHLPDDAMHSFDGGNNEIVWTVSLAGTIRYWPDVASEFPLVVQPREVRR